MIENLSNKIYNLQWSKKKKSNRMIIFFKDVGKSVCEIVYMKLLNSKIFQKETNFFNVINQFGRKYWHEEELFFSL